MSRTESTPLALAVACVLSCGEAQLDENFGVDPSFTDDAFYATDADIGGAYIAGDAADRAAADEGTGFLLVNAPPKAFDPKLVAARAAGSAGSTFSPPGCASAVAFGGEVTYTLERCSGPLGMRDLTGQITVRYESTRAELRMRVSSNELSSSGHAVVLDLTLRRSATGERARRLSVTSNSSLSGERSLVHRDIGFEIRYAAESGCVEVTGRGDLDLDGRTLDYTLDGYSRCAGLCPKSGLLTLQDDSRSASVRFDGTNQPAYATSDRRSGKLELECEP
jgi:hypothetical protein